MLASRKFTFLLSHQTVYHLALLYRSSRTGSPNVAVARSLPTAQNHGLDTPKGSTTALRTGVYRKRQSLRDFDKTRALFWEPYGEPPSTNSCEQVRIRADDKPSTVPQFRMCANPGALRKVNRRFRVTTQTATGIMIWSGGTVLQTLAARVVDARLRGEVTMFNHKSLPASDALAGRSRGR